MKVLITPTVLMNGQVKLIDPCTKFLSKLINFALRNYVTGEIILSKIQRKVYGVYHA